MINLAEYYKIYKEEFDRLNPDGTDGKPHSEIIYPAYPLKGLEAESKESIFDLESFFKHEQP